MSNLNRDDPFEQSSPEPPSEPPAPRKTGRRLWIWIIGIFGGLMFLGVLGCCGGGYFLLNFLTGEYQRQLADNPVILEHLGQIESMGMNLTKTAEASESSGGNTFAFDIQGSLASGTVLIKQDPSADGVGIESAELILADGSRHQVPLGGNAPEVDVEFEIDPGEIDLGEIDMANETIDEGVPQP